MNGGFVPSWPGRPGSPLAAQWFNWLFSTLSVNQPFVVPAVQGAATIKNLFAIRIGGEQTIKGIEVRGFVSDGSLANRRMIYLPSYTIGTTVTASGCTITPNGITIPASIWSPSVIAISVTPLTEAP